jgi:hypothetical protein
MLPAWSDERQIPEHPPLKTSGLRSKTRSPRARVSPQSADRPVHRLRPRAEIAKSRFNIIGGQQFQPEEPD